jgi:hypothetical protein
VEAGEQPGTCLCAARCLLRPARNPKLTGSRSLNPPNRPVRTPTPGGVTGKTGDRLPKCNYSACRSRSGPRSFHALWRVYARRGGRLGSNLSRAQAPLPPPSGPPPSRKSRSRTGLRRR